MVAPVISNWNGDDLEKISSGLRAEYQQHLADLVHRQVEAINALTHYLEAVGSFQDLIHLARAQAGDACKFPKFREYSVEW